MATQNLRHAPSVSWLLLIALAALLTSSEVQLTADDATRELTKSWVEERRAEFQQYDFRREAIQPTNLTMEPQSILNWSNPERGAATGALFLWTDQGRPQLIACAFEWNGRLNHEFHSLSTDPITAQRLATPVHRFDPGIEFKALPEAPTPAGERRLRLTQMRRLAERFRVTSGKSETRLLTQPVFRSPEALSDDVAVFVFVQGTDPECTLLLEATGMKEWRYALARQTKWALKVELDQRLVWEPTPLAKVKADAPFVVLPQNTAK
jgi:hypothetical protein